MPPIIAITPLSFNLLEEFILSRASSAIGRKRIKQRLSTFSRGCRKAPHWKCCNREVAKEHRIESVVVVRLSKSTALKSVVVVRLPKSTALKALWWWDCRKAPHWKRSNREVAEEYRIECAVIKVDDNRRKESVNFLKNPLKCRR